MNNIEYNWFKLMKIPGFGTKSRNYVYSCLEKRGLSINNLFEMSLIELEELLPDIGVGKFSKSKHQAILNLDSDKAFSDYEKLKSENITVISIDNDLYPKLALKNLKDNSPVVLFCTGYLPLLQNSNNISVVGSREIDDFALKNTHRIGKILADNGFNVTSGYAKGVDTAAHFGALESGGTTSMILSYGTNYLSIKKDIKDLDWEKNTLFISQFLPYEKFSGANAMIRNKLVCALSKAVIVICSGPEKDTNGKQSGTFDAGKTALEMKIPLFVLTSEVLKKDYQGNNDLIKLGGIPINNGKELIDNLNKLDSIKAELEIESKFLNKKQGTLGFN
jgi:DNA processing protein